MSGLPRRRALLLAAGLAAGVLVLVWLGVRSQEAARKAWAGTWVLQAEELGAFTSRALAGRNDLLVVERFRHLVRRDDVAYVLVLDRNGKALINSDVAATGRVYDSDYAKRALSSPSTLVQEIPAMGVLEVDVPVGAGSVLRVGFSFKPLAASGRWLWGMVGLACVLLASAGLPLLRAG